MGRLKKVLALSLIMSLGAVNLTGCSKLIQAITGPTMSHAEAIEKYGDLCTYWQNENVFEGGGATSAYETLLDAAESGDRDKFASCFTKELRGKSGFVSMVDEFLKAYPKGLKDAEMKYSPAGAGGSFDGGKAVNGAGAKYEGKFKGETYYILIKFCYVNDNDPDKVGVEFFTIENEGAKAANNAQSSSDPDYWEKTVMLCDIRNDVNYRIIGGTPILWRGSSVSELTADELRTLLAKSGSLDDPELKAKIGEPGNERTSYSSAGVTYYFEIQPKDGKPQYAYIIAQTNWGKIYDAYLCTEESTDFDNPLYSMPR